MINTLLQQTKPLEIPADVTALEGRRVLYQHFNCFRTWYTGTIEQAKVTASGVEIYICPDKDDNLSLQSKWKNLATDSVLEIVEPDFGHSMLNRLYRMQMASKSSNLAELYRVERPDYLKGE